MTTHEIALAAGRGLLALLFVLAGLTKIIAPKPVLAHMRQERLPGLALPFVVLFELAAGSALLLGFRTGLAAGLLACFCLATAFVFHRNFKERAERTQFMKDLGLAGALLFIAAQSA